MKKLTPFISLTAAFCLLFLTACSAAEKPDGETLYPDARTITLSKDSAEIDGKPVAEGDYTWHCDPSVAHDEVKDAPAEYYTGAKPETDDPVYIDRELYYFPELPEDGFSLVNYDGETEWAYYYNDGENDDYIFATLPRLGNSLPTEMMHSEAEAAENKVLHITEAGTYILEGEWAGQVWVDLGDKDETFADSAAKVTLVLNGADINCSAAPGIVFYSAYECDNTWEERAEYGADVEKTDVGVTVIIADGTENTVTGTNVFRMLKTKYKDEDSADEIKVQKKMRKTDGAFYSYVSMAICGETENSGKLTVNAGFEGIDSELHLFFNGGDVTVNSQDDGVNVNEDDVSVVNFCGSAVTLNAGLGAEGDGVDSNGYIVIDGSTVNVNGVTPPDSALDSECGVYYKSGSVVIDGEKQEYTAGDVFRESGETGGPGGMGKPGGMPDEPGNAPGGFSPRDFDIKDFKEKVAALPDDATFEDVMNILGADGMQNGDPGRMPENMADRKTGEAPEVPPA